MTGLGLRSVSESTPAEPPTPRPIESEITEEYARIAQDIGLDSGAVLESRVLAFCAKHGIRVFNYDEVVSYMNAEYPKITTDHHSGWDWTCLRSCDCGKIAPMGSWRSNGHVSSRRVYNYPVPLPVLYTVKRMVEEFGDSVCFLVGAPADRRGDPFLAVTAVGMNFTVIERWDEPGFIPK